MNRRVRFGLVLAVGLSTTPAVGVAQSSQFGIRGLGIPMRPFSPRATATGGAFAMFDVESSLNPAGLASVLQFTALLSTSQSYRSSSNDFGSASGRDGRFPQITVVGPIGGTRLAGSVSLSGYTDRSFSIATTDSIDIRGQRLAVFDTLSSTGGLTDVRLALAWRASSRLNVGIAAHAIPGSNRFLNSRAFSDSAYSRAVERNDLSYMGHGISGGVTIRPAARLTIAALVRADTRLTTRRDSSDIATTDLPVSFGGAIRFEPSLKLALAASYMRRNWSVADADIRAQGGVGAENATDFAAGVEILRDARNPRHRPIRFGFHYATLPFPVQTGAQPKEYGVAIGTGIRFTAGRGGIDVALQQLWRSDGEGFTERATVVTLGVSLRP